MRVDVIAEFYVRVAAQPESVAAAAQTLGLRTMEPAQLKELVEALASKNSTPRSSMALMLEQIELKRSALHSQIETAQAQLLLLNQLEHELLHSPELMNCELPVDSSPKGKL